MEEKELWLERLVKDNKWGIKRKDRGYVQVKEQNLQIRSINRLNEWQSKQNCAKKTWCFCGDPQFHGVHSFIWSQLWLELSWLHLYNHVVPLKNIAMVYCKLKRKSGSYVCLWLCSRTTPHSEWMWKRCFSHPQDNMCS